VRRIELTWVEHVDKTYSSQLWILYILYNSIVILDVITYPVEKWFATGEYRKITLVTIGQKHLLDIDE
jgi:hypothetical protein